MSLDIDKKTTALVVVDLQKGIAAMDRQLAPHSASTVIQNAAKIAELFRKNGMPVFLVHVVISAGEMLNVMADEQPWSGRDLPKDFSDFAPDLHQKESDIVITKRQWGAFYGTDLELQLRRRGIKTIVLCGISTNHGVESTARFAYEYGFQQIFVEDAMSSMSAEMHNAAINIALKRIGRVRKTDEILESMR
ncbi:MAG TPA: hydrolase [Candidatus Acidoferrum sp.]|nr:hydrolase [Candidatus Acidoferrum sp.]